MIVSLSLNSRGSVSSMMRIGSVQFRPPSNERLVATPFRPPSASGSGSGGSLVEDQADLMEHAVRAERQPRVGRPLELAARTVAQTGDHDGLESLTAVQADAGNVAARAAVGPAILLPEGDDVVRVGRVRPRPRARPRCSRS